MFRLFTLSLLVLVALISDSTASVTLLITGHSSDNVYKHQLASLFVHSYEELIEGSNAPLLAFTNGVSMPVAKETNNLLKVWNDLNMPTNVTTLVLTNLGTDEMSLEHLSVLQRFMRSKKAFIVIEIGNLAVQTTALLNRSASCLLGGHAVILSPNAVYFCNKATPNMLPNLLFDDLHEITVPKLEPNWEQHHVQLLMPNIFASAAKASEKRHRGHEHHDHHHDHREHHHHHHPHHHHRKHHLEEDVDEIVDQIIQEIIEEGVISSPKKTKEFNELTEDEKKMFCKYRKSCYETGEKPKIDDSLFSWWSSEAAEEVKQVEEAKPYDPEEDLVEQKFQCKYRISCYHERGIPITEKVADKEKKMVLASKMKPQQGKKKTLKDIAAKMLQDVKEAEEKAAKRPVVTVVESKLNAIEEKLQEKLNCKYRKSCYETGQKPVIEDAWSLSIPIIFSTESADTMSKHINYSELEELEKKVYCKYRKSCYETGVKPEIEPEIFIHTIADLTTLHEQVETRKLTLQEKCKYRKSCYETGIVPEINPKLEAAIQKEVSSVIPTNVQELKMLCKYRKSCYAEIHDSATVDTIKIIRKRRQIEKEVKRRKARRAKLHRRLHGEMQLGHWRKSGRKTPAGEIKQKVAVSERIKEVNVTPTEEKRERVVEEKTQDDTDQEKEQVVVESRKGRSRKARQQLQKETVQDAKVEEKVELAATEPVEKETQPKKHRRIRKVKVEPQIEPKPVVKKVTPSSKTAKKPKEGLAAEELVQPEQTPKTAEEQKPKEEPKSEVKKESRKKKEMKEPPTPVKEKVIVNEEQKVVPEKVVDEVKNTSGTKKEEKRHLGAKPAMQKMVDDMHHRQKIQQNKEFCKYRKSCYATGEKPEVKQTVGTLYTTFTKHVDKTLEEEEAAAAAAAAAKSRKTEADKKLECKYRKSCYETGVLPEIKAPEKHGELGIVFKAGVSKQLQCKYRKSCYVEAGIIAAADLVADTEEKRKPTDQRAEAVEDHKETREDKDSTAKKSPKEVRASAEQKAQAEAGKSGEECKAGKACYTSAEPKTMKEDHAGSMARIGLERYRKNGKCSPYYYSCREVLGLPKKEKAPIGPNGKRLCRKKPKSL